VTSTPPFSDRRVPEPGAIVHVRQRLYLVERIQAPPNPGDATLVSLSCVDDDAQGQALDVLWEHELDAEIRGGENWQRLAERPFDRAQSNYERDARGRLPYHEGQECKKLSG
jgi:hypothetical protein